MLLPVGEASAPMGGRHQVQSSLVEMHFLALQFTSHPSMEQNFGRGHPQKSSELVTSYWTATGAIYIPD